nr:immunoglobulin heavy chain junction region [Mus musculus]
SITVLGGVTTGGTL